MARDIAVDVLDEVWRRDSTPQDAACRYCGASVVHSVRRPAEAIRAHFDVVDPNEPATVDNVVVACPACNMRKGNRTPSEAGMSLTEPVVEREAPSGEGRRIDLARRKVTLARRTADRRRRELAVAKHCMHAAEDSLSVAEDRVRAAEAALATALADSVRPDEITRGPGALYGHTTVSLYDDAVQPVLSIVGADASRVREAAAAIRAAESAPGA